MLINESSRVRAVWLPCLASAFRTGLACAIVGGITLHGPASLRSQIITFPAFSYVVAILIVTDATLGDTLRGCWHALCATGQGVCPAILALSMLGPSRLTPMTTVLALALSAFVVALPGWTHLISKRIALGQIVLVYVTGFINGDHTEAVMHPVHLAASTAVGAVACVLALLLPYPSLACYEVKQNCKILAENASERLKLYVEAFCAEDSATTLAFVSQAKSLSSAGSKLLQTINSKQESMQWERLPFKCLKPFCKNPGERFQELETPLRGMEIALSNPHSCPSTILDQDLRDCLHNLDKRTSLSLEKFKTFRPPDLATFPESVSEHMISLQSLDTIPHTQEDLPSFFFLFCFKLLQIKLLPSSLTKPPTKTLTEPRKKEMISFKSLCSTLGLDGRFLPAFKCSLSLGLAAIFGLMYSKEYGYWAALPMAISQAAAREPAFKVAGLKAQGTVLGNIYGVLGCIVFERFVKIRFISLLPWFIFCSLVRRSRMYGQAGGISAVIGAVLILGRENFGPPIEFAISRIVEIFIGLSCSIIVEILIKPRRASTLAKIQVSKTLSMLHECVEAVRLGGSKDCSGDSHKKLKAHVNELRKFIEEAEVEPNFWFLPFHSAAYNKLLTSLSNMVDSLLFASHAIGLLEQETGRIEGTLWMESENKLDGELELLKEMVCPSVKCFEEVILVKSLNKLEKDVQKKNNTPSSSNSDVELGSLPIPKMLKSSNKDIENEIDKIVNAFLEHSKELVLEKVNVGQEGVEEEEEGGNKVDHEMVILSLSALVYSMSGLVRESREIEKGIKDIVQWENPTSHVNLFDISCKIHALYD